MRVGLSRRAGVGLLALALVAGCARQEAQETKQEKASSEDTAARVKARFGELQAAAKAGDEERLWALLADKSRTDAERIAKEVRSAYAAAGAEGKKRQEESLGLSGKELAELTGKGYLRTKRFRRKANEIAGGEYKKVNVEKESARVSFFDPEDNETEHVQFVREAGEWKAWLSIPRPLKLD
jgi:hypothetical protein